MTEVFVVREMDQNGHGKNHDAWTTWSLAAKDAEQRAVIDAEATRKVVMVPEVTIRVRGFDNKVLVERQRIGTDFSQDWVILRVYSIQRLVVHDCAIDRLAELAR